MSRIRSKGTRLEMKMKKALEENGIEFQYQPKIYGKPDFLIPLNVVLFCDSSFWHGRNWSRLEKKLPEEYWRNHIGRNRERDKAVNERLKKDGFLVLRFWDSLIEKNLERCIDKIKQVLGSQVEIVPYGDQNKIREVSD